MTDNEAKNLLAGHEHLLRNCVNDGFDRFRRGNLMLSSQIQCSSRTLSNMLHDSVVTVAREILPEPVRFVAGYHRNFFSFGGYALLQFKRLGQDGRPSNFPTILAQQIEETGCASLPGLDPLPLLTIGYEVPETNHCVNDIVVLRVTESGVSWKYSIAGTPQLINDRMVFLDQNDAAALVETAVRPKLPSIDERLHRSSDSA